VNQDELLFAETHEWAHIAEQDGGKVATIGISAHAVEALTDLVYMDLPTVGTEVTSGNAFGEVESVKATSELYSPVDGEIIDMNRIRLPKDTPILDHRKLDKSDGK
jgi:glycine cleavage system H protein